MKYRSGHAARVALNRVALAALVAFCRNHGIAQIDCQQNTAHLASMGAAEMPRSAFLSRVANAAQLPSPKWDFEPVYWNSLLTRPASTT